MSKDERKTVRHTEWVVNTYDAEEGSIGSFLMVLRWEPYEDRVLWIDFDLYEVVANGIKSDETPLFQVSPYSDEFTPRYEEAAPTISGFVKWDGCTEVTGLDVHYCELREASNRFQAFVAARKACFRCGEWEE